MPFRIVQSKQNSRLKELRRALAHPGRERQRVWPASKGRTCSKRLCAPACSIDSVFVAQGAENLLEPCRFRRRPKCCYCPENCWTPLYHRNAAADRRPDRAAGLELGGSSRPAQKAAPLVLVLAGLQDPGNLGTILRSAEAFGATGVLSLPGTVSAWNPKAVRASAGSVFRLPCSP